MVKVKQFHSKYSAEFKLSVILDLMQNNLNYREAVRRHWNTSSKTEEDRYRTTVRDWHRIFLEYGEDGFMAKQGRPKKPKFDYEKVKNTDPAELSKEQLLELIVYQQAEIEYLKKLKALVQAEEQKKKQR